MQIASPVEPGTEVAQLVGHPRVSLATTPIATSDSPFKKPGSRLLGTSKNTLVVAMEICACTRGMGIQDNTFCTMSIMSTDPIGGMGITPVSSPQELIMGDVNEMKTNGAAMGSAPPAMC